MATAPQPAVPLAIALEPTAAVPVYRQIAAQIRAAVEAGRLEGGDRLPTIRALAAGLGVHRDTIGLAYEALAAEGVVEAHVGRGPFVRGRRARATPAAHPADPAFAPVVERLLDVERGRTRYPDGADLVPLHALV